MVHFPDIFLLKLSYFFGKYRYLNFGTQLLHFFFVCHLLKIITILLIFFIRSSLFLVSKLLVLCGVPLIENRSLCNPFKMPYLMAQIQSRFLLCNSHLASHIVSAFPYLYSFFFECFWLPCFLHSCLASLLFFRYIRCQGKRPALKQQRIGNT